MSVPEGARGEGRFTLPIKAEELARYTLTITKNENVFLPDYQRQLTDDLVNCAKNAYLSIREANDIRVDPTSETFLADKRSRQNAQKDAIRFLKRMLPLIDLSRRVFHLSTKRVKYWGGMVVEVRDRTRHWMESDMRRYSQE